MGPTDLARSLAAGQWARVIGWGAYLGCSWTWCIGMFLPVLLVRDFGIWGFAVFAIPNVIGAMAMGWVLRRPATQAWVREHGAALAWFMRVTLAFEWFFFGWLASSVHAWWLGLGVLVVGGVWPQPEGRGWRRLALGTWCVSVACALVYLMTAPASLAIARTPRLPVGDVGWLAPVCAFGFALCPYLDLTFHNARRQLEPRESRAAFSLGFGMFFFAMIAFTLAYTPLLIEGGLAGMWPLGVAAVAVTIHMTMRIGFTTFAFVDAFDRLRPQSRMGFAGVGLVALLIAGYLAGYLAAGRRVHGFEAPELGYRAFMAFYGLAFPAYVWICAIPYRGDASSSPRGRMGAFWLAVVAAAPCYWLGFIEKRTEWLGVGLGIVLLARVLGARARK